MKVLLGDIYHFPHVAIHCVFSLCRSVDIDMIVDRMNSDICPIYRSLRYTERLKIIHINANSDGHMVIVQLLGTDFYSYITFNSIIKYGIKDYELMRRIKIAKI